MWTTAKVRQEQLHVLEQLDEFAPDSRERLQKCLSKVKEYAGGESERDRLRRLIWVMSALVQQGRFGGLSDAQVRSLTKVAHAVLEASQIEPETSQLKFLFSDLYQVLSQVDRRDGQAWSSIWNLLMAQRYRVHDQSVEARFQLGEALRHLRLGDGPRARDLLEACREHLAGTQFFVASMAYVLALRLQGDVDLTEGVLSELHAQQDLSEFAESDILWERLLVRARATGDYVPIVVAVGNKQRHHQSAYFLEAVLWARAHRSIDLVKRLPLVRSMARSRSLKAHRSGPLYDAGLTLEMCYDTDRPFEWRLRKLGEMLNQRHGLLTIDKELLLLAASSRWLYRVKATDFYDLVRGEYSSLSLKLSGGVTNDALGLELPD